MPPSTPPLSDKSYTTPVAPKKRIVLDQDLKRVKKNLLPLFNRAIQTSPRGIGIKKSIAWK